MTSLSSYFKGTASKYLSAVDATSASNQHEFGLTSRLTSILGNPGSERLPLKATFLFFNSDTEEPEICTDTVTYYDVRLNQPHRKPEYRLYYRDNLVTEQLREGDFCVFGAQTNNDLLIAVARPGTDHERRLRYVFDIDNARQQWVDGGDVSSVELDLASRSILEALGIELIDSADEMLDRLVGKFGLKFPTTKEFSTFTRETLGHHISPKDSPDIALEEWMKQEERLFRSLEKAIVEVRLKKGFDAVEPFIAFSLSVQNRRKSRVGHALENHLEAVFIATGVKYERGARTEGNAKPDFLFPGATEYRNQTVAASQLYMLAAKTTCKDRWRQILAEAALIPNKHLFTLETAISESQTAEMERQHVQLVVPPSIARTYSLEQQEKLMSLENLVSILPK